MVQGEAGVGKSALLEYMVGAATDMQVARAAGVESEMELAFAGLHLLCAPLLDRLESLPVPQRDALGVAFGLREGAVPDRFLVGLAVLTLLSEAAEDQPLLCVVDDAQWLDAASAQVLAFAARRLLAEPVGLVFAARVPDKQLRGLADLEVAGLPDQEARALLRSVVRFGFDERIRDRILAEASGNPLALLELPRGLRPEQLAGGFGLVGARPGTYRGGVSASAGSLACRYAVTDAGRGAGADRRPGAGVAGGQAATDPGLGCSRSRDRRIAAHRDARAVPASAGPLGGLLGGVAAGAAGGARRAGRRDRPRPGPGPAGMAPGRGSARAR